MTIKELIKELEKFPDHNATVLVSVCVDETDITDKLNELKRFPENGKETWLSGEAFGEVESGGDFVIINGGFGY